MTSKFTDRLKRLHESRVRALSSEDPEEPRVFTAEPEEPTAPVARATTHVAKPEHSVAEGQLVARAPVALDDAKREQLERQRRLASRSKPRKLTMQRTGESTPPHAAPATGTQQASVTAPRGRSNAVGERLGDLRIQASALVAAGRSESALPLLHEMVSLSPSNPYPLAELMKYYRACGMHEFADLYEGRLRAVAPY